MLQLLQKSQVLTKSCTVLDSRSCTSWFARYPISGFLKTSNEPVATGEWHGDIVQWTNLHAMHWNQRLLVQLTMCHGALVWQIGGAARWCLYNLRWSIQHYQSHARIHIHKPINGIQHTRRIGPAAIVSKSLESHTVKVLNVVYVLSLRGHPNHRAILILAKLPQRPTSEFYGLPAFPNDIIWESIPQKWFGM